MLEFFHWAFAKQVLSYKDCMREAARRVRTESLFQNPDASVEMKIVLSSISRSLWFSGLPLARKLLRWSSIAKDLVYIVDYKVLAYSYESFEQIFADFYTVFIDQKSISSKTKSLPQSR